MKKNTKSSSRKSPIKTRKLKVLPSPIPSSPQPTDYTQCEPHSSPIPQKEDIPRTVDGIEVPTTTSMADMAKFLAMIVKTQENTMAILSSIQDSIGVMEQKIDENNDVITSRIETVSKQTQTTARRIDDLSASLTASKAAPQSQAPAPAADSTVSSALERKNKELTDMIITEKKKSDLRGQCTRIKRNICLQWTHSLNERKKHYNNFVKNYKKHGLYKDWMESSPDFLPLKYKPKRVPGEISSHTEAKISEAKQRYQNDVTLMLDYSKVHQSKVTKVDQGATQLIRDSCETEEQIQTLQEMWRDEISEQESRAAQAWTKTERFLCKKKHEDEVRNEETLTSTAW